MNWEDRPPPPPQPPAIPALMDASLLTLQVAADIFTTSNVPS